MKAALISSEQTSPSGWSRQVGSQVVAAQIGCSKITESCPLTQRAIKPGMCLFDFVLKLFSFVSVRYVKVLSSSKYCSYLLAWIMLEQLMRFFHFAELSSHHKLLI